MIGVALTNNNSSLDQKLNFALKMYDLDNNNGLSMEETEKLVRGLNQFSGNDKLNQTDQPKITAKNIFTKYDKGIFN